MKSFKEQITADLQIFLNLDHFAELHTVEGQEIKVVLDDDKLVERQGGAELGVAEADLLMYAKASDLPPRKAPGSAINIDGREYIVTDWREDMGLATVALRQNRSI
ncbi:hypothetical protein CTHBC1_2667 [Acetivibrio thermocellus BC1]|nr:hypothetical protein CTHBC1_2667 [Acetivibrio thermocellus BC1]